jgi:hypothetical protein
MLSHAVVPGRDKAECGVLGAWGHILLLPRAKPCHAELAFMLARAPKVHDSQLIEMRPVRTRRHVDVAPQEPLSEAAGKPPGPVYLHAHML